MYRLITAIPKHDLTEDSRGDGQYGQFLSLFVMGRDAQAAAKPNEYARFDEVDLDGLGIWLIAYCERQDSRAQPEAAREKAYADMLDQVGARYWQSRRMIAEF